VRLRLIRAELLRSRLSFLPTPVHRLVSASYQLGSLDQYIVQVEMIATVAVRVQPMRYAMIHERVTIPGTSANYYLDVSRFPDPVGLCTTLTIFIDTGGYFVPDWVGSHWRISA
tara:strand:- start:902 stop:1243 length:342 start_codon:yes stop_codon:yes gene_type:complete